MTDWSGHIDVLLGSGIILVILAFILWQFHSKIHILEKIIKDYFKWQ